MTTHPSSSLFDMTAFDPTVPVDHASTPPAAWYTDPGFHALERDTVFRRSWLIVGRADQVKAPGDFFTGTLADEPFIVLRDADGVLRAHFNVCQHHGACVMREAEGHTKQLTCPYHGWSYRLDGSLLRAPQVGPIKAFQREQFSLKPIPVTLWSGLVFIYLGAGAPPDLNQQLAPLQARLDAFGLDGLTFHARRTYTLACNWKVFVDNYLDGGYHVQTIHPELSKELAAQSYTTESFARFSIQSSRSEESAGARLGDGALYAFVYPNLMINRYGPVMDLNIAIPIAEDRCEVIFDYFFLETGPWSDREAFIADCITQSDQIQQEDMAICASVQRGLRSSAYDRGRYAPLLEHAMHSFHCLLSDDYRQG